MATQRVLESLDRRALSRFVYTSSSFVYGDAERVPTKQTSCPRPISAYGVTKLAAENLVHLYSRNHRLPATCLRYFTVYGPRKRPDMATARFMQALVACDVVEVLGSGEQTRDFTYVGDAVDAIIRAATADVAGKILNIGGGGRASINPALDLIEEISGRSVVRQHLPAAQETSGIPVLRSTKRGT